jgi:hypothetical protein
MRIEEPEVAFYLQHRAVQGLQNAEADGGGEESLSAE